MVHFLFKNNCKIILFFVLFPTGWFVYGKVNSTTKSNRVTLSNDVILELYKKYKEAVINARQPESQRRLFKKNREFKIHVKRLNAVNGNKRHNLLIREILRNGDPLIYVNNPLESELPHPYITLEEFKKTLSERDRRQKEHFTKLRSSTLGKRFFRTFSIRTTRKSISLKSTKLKLNTSISISRKGNKSSKATKPDLRKINSVKQTTKLKSISLKVIKRIKVSTVSVDKSKDTTAKPIYKNEANNEKSTAKEVTESPAESTTGSTSESTSETTTKATSESTIVPTTESNAESTSEGPTTEVTTESIAGSTSEGPTTEVATESIAESTSEGTTTEVTTESNAESTSEVPTAEVTTESIAESTSEEPTTEATTESTRITLGQPAVWMGSKK